MKAPDVSPGSSGETRESRQGRHPVPSLAGLGFFWRALGTCLPGFHIPPLCGWQWLIRWLGFDFEL
jgi:hypothetical protein